LHPQAERNKRLREGKGRGFFAQITGVASAGVKSPDDSDTGIRKRTLCCKRRKTFISGKAAGESAGGGRGNFGDGGGGGRRLWVQKNCLT